MTGRPSGPRPRFDRAAVYRQVRAFHGYLSALAFVLLMAFSLTGIFLNHPAWFREARPADPDRTLRLPPEDVARAGSSPEALAGLVARALPLRGGFKSGEVLDGEARLRFEGVTGHSDVAIDLATGSAEVSVTRASLVGTLNDLHRGKNAGAVWSAVIDVTAIVVLALSLLGYVIFFSLRFRLRTSLALTAISLAGLAAIFALAIP